MSGSSDRFRDLDALLAAVCDQTAGPDDIQRIESLAGDAEGIERVLDYLHIDGLLRWEHGSGVETSDDNFDADAQAEPTAVRFDALTPPIIVQTPDSSPSSFFNPQSPFATGLVSYAAALLIMCAALLGAWAYKINHCQPFAIEQTPSINNPDVQIVARITGAKDCVCAADQPQPYVGSATALGRKYTLSSGLLEITYTTGARVILEGPCEYRVDSNAGGHLALGKLTALVERRRERREEGRVADAKPQAAKSQSPIPNPQSLFSVTTPTAVVTDLGTEFGVEVSESGNTLSHVFRGSVHVQALSSSGESRTDGQGDSVVLHADQSARVEKSENATGTNLIAGGNIAESIKFARRLLALPKQLDLLDIVAGGNGLENRRERGIDPGSGNLVAKYPARPFTDKQRPYVHVGCSEYIDGVFVPNGNDGAVRIDSAGHRFDDFPHTSGRTWGAIWSRAKNVSSFNEWIAKDDSAQHWLYAMGHGEKFMPENRGLLCLCANVGITFDLQAMRKHYSGVYPSRFRARAGIVDAAFRTRVDPKPSNMADIWIFVDGRVAFQRMELQPTNGILNINVELKPNDRFLSFVITDSADTSVCDWVVFGDPVLETTAISPMEISK